MNFMKKGVEGLSSILGSSVDDIISGLVNNKSASTRMGDTEVSVMKISRPSSSSSEIKVESISSKEFFGGNYDDGCDCDKCKLKKAHSDFDRNGVYNKLKDKDYFEDLTNVLQNSISDENYKVIKTIFDNVKTLDEKALYFIIAQYYKKNNNREKMTEYYLKLVNMNSVKAMIILGMDYLKSEDFANANKYLEFASINIPDDDNNANLKSYLLNCFGQYYDAINDSDNMIASYVSSSNLGNINSTKQLSNIFYDKDDYSNALIYLKILVDKNDFYLINRLALTYKQLGQKSDMINTFILGDKNGNNECTFNLGVHYFRRKCFNKALSNFLKLKEYDVGISLFYIGLCYEEKELIETDSKKIFKYNNLAKIYYDKAIQQKNIQAIEHIGHMLERENEMELCKNYYFYAYENGLAIGYSLLGKLFRKEKDYKTMMLYLNEGAKNDDIDSIYELALYYDDIGNEDKMVEFMKKSSGRKHMASLRLYYHYCLKKDDKNMMKYYNLLKNKHNFGKGKILELFMNNHPKI